MQRIDDVGHGDEAFARRNGPGRDGRHAYILAAVVKLKDLLSLEDFEDAARRVLPRPIFGYGAGSVETGASLRANLAAWDELAFVPRMLVDTSARTQKAVLFGRTYDAPFGIAPMGGTSMAAYEG